MTVQLFLSAMALGGLLVLIVIRAEVWYLSWKQKRRR